MSGWAASQLEIRAPSGHGSKPQACLIEYRAIEAWIFDSLSSVAHAACSLMRR